LKTNRLLLIAALCYSLLLTGCGGDSGDGIITTGGGGGIIPGTDPTNATVGSVSIVFGSGSTSEEMIANGTDFRLVRVNVLDTDGADLSGKTVSFTTTSGSFSPSSAVTTAEGLAQVNFVAPNNLGSATLRASVDGVTSDSLSATFVPGPPSFMYDINAAPLQLQPKGESTLTVRITDANGFPVESETVAFTFTAQGSGLPLISPAFIETDANGQVVVTYTAGANGGTQAATIVDTIQAQTTNGVAKTVSIEIATDAVVVSNLLLTGENTAVVGNSVGITAKVISTSGSPELIPVTFTLSDFTLGGLNGGTNDVTDATDINGDAFVTFNAGSKVGKVTVSATASGFIKTLVIDLTSAAPATLTLSAAPASVSVASPLNLNRSDIIATVEDAFGNPIPGETVNFYIFEIDKKTGGTVGASATTNLSGIARVLYSAGGTPGTDRITGETTSAAIISTVDITATPDISKVASISITADINVLPEGAVSNIIVTARDNTGNAVPGVTLSVTHNGGISADLPGPFVTNGSGQLILTLTDSEAEDVTVTVVAGTLVTQKQFFFGPSLEFVPDTVSGIGEVTLTVRLLNGGGVPIAGAPISFSLISVDDEFTDQLDLVTKANGTAQLRVTDPATGGTVEIRASSGGVDSTTAATINFQTEPDAYALSAKAAYTALISGGNSDIVATIVNTDDGTPAASISLDVLVSGSAVADPVTGVTDAFGKFVFNVTDAVDEDVIVTISDSSGSLTVDVPLYFGATTQLFPPSATGIADGATITALQAIVRSANGSGVPAAPVDFSVTTGSAIISGSRILTDASGLARVNVTDSAIETATVEAFSGTTDIASSDILFSAGGPAEIILKSTSLKVSLFGTAALTATVTDSLGNFVSDNTTVTFTTTGGSVTASAPTLDGVATATFDAGTVSGRYTVTATAGTVVDTVEIEVTPLSAGTIKVESVTPGTVQVLGTTGEQTATIRFLVQDAASNLVSGQEVTISLDSLQLGGGELISSGGPFSTSVTAITTNGIVQVVVRSGSVAGTLDITAQVDPDVAVSGDEFSTVAQVIIAGGVADSNHFTLAAETLNLAGGLYVNLPSTVSAVVADRFSNIVPDGTSISFQSECGRIGESGGFTASTEQGIATAVFRTSNPMIPTNLLAGPAPVGRTGLCKILAYTTGDESYYDANGNGIFDAGDTCTGDLSEPYIDANDNGSHEALELYVDIDNSGGFTAADGVCSSDTTIWTSMNLLMSEYADLSVVPDPDPGGAISLAVGESQPYKVTFGDTFGNAVVAGTTVTVTQIRGVGGLITGTTNFTQGDTNGTEGEVFFTVSSDGGGPETIEIEVVLVESDAMLTDDVTGADTIPNNNGISIKQNVTLKINQP